MAAKGNYLANANGLDAGPALRWVGRANGSKTIPTNGVGHVTLGSGTFLYSWRVHAYWSGRERTSAASLAFTIPAPHHLDESSEPDRTCP